MATEPAARPHPEPPPRAPARDVPARARERMPGGTDSNFRAWGEATIYVDRGKGGLVWDVDGNEFVDLRMGYGPVILGHGDERVDDYVNERMRKGVSFSLTSEDEVRAIELVCELTGWVDMARMTVSGTEATMHAMRVARAFTGREQDREVRGPVPRRPRLRADQRRAGRHVRARRRRRAGRPRLGSRHPGRGRRHDHPGPLQPHRPAAHASSSSAARRSPRSSSSPSSATPRAIMPEPGFHQADAGADRGVRDPADLRRGQDRLPLRRAAAPPSSSASSPDLATFAKAMGNGYPAAAFGGRREIMERAARQGQPWRHVRRQPGRRRGRRRDARRSSRDTNALETIHATGRSDPGRPRGDPRPDRPPVPLHRPPVDVRDHVPRGGRRPSTATGPQRPRAVRRDRHRHARPRGDAGARFARAVVHVRGARRRRHHRSGPHRRSPDSLDAALEERAHGGPAPTPHGGMASPAAG